MIQTNLYASLVVLFAYTLLIVVLGLAIGIRIGRNERDAKRLRIYRLLAGYELLTAYVRLRVLPFMEQDGVVTLPAVLRGLLQETDAVRGYLSHADDGSRMEVIRSAYQDISQPNLQILRLQLPVWTYLEEP